jgi:hypothetical protein
MNDAKNIDGSRWRHFRIDGLDIGHINGNSGHGFQVPSSTDGPLSWVTRGLIDINALIQLAGTPDPRKLTPKDIFLDNLVHIMTDLSTSIEKRQEAGDKNGLSDSDAIVSSDPYSESPFMLGRWSIEDGPQQLGDRLAGKVLTIIHKNLLSPLVKVMSKWKKVDVKADRLPVDISQRRKLAEQFYMAPEDTILVHMDIQLRNIRATMPFYTSQLSWVNNTLAKPIVAYMNQHRPLIPLTCFVEMKEKDWAGAWTFYDSGFSDALFRSVHDGLVRLILTERAKKENYVKLGLWGLSAISRIIHRLYDSMHA